MSGTDGTPDRMTSVCPDRSKQSLNLNRLSLRRAVRKPELKKLNLKGLTFPKCMVSDRNPSETGLTRNIKSAII